MSKSKLEMFRLGFEYDLNLREIKRLLKTRKIV